MENARLARFLLAMCSVGVIGLSSADDRRDTRTYRIVMFHVEHFSTFTAVATGY
jgi:hypothetical protein